MMDDVEFRIAKLDVKPGDVLVAKFDMSFPAVTAVRVHKLLQDKLPDGVKVLVIERGCDLSVLTFDEIQRRTKLADAA